MQTPSARPNRLRRARRLLPLSAIALVALAATGCTILRAPVHLGSAALKDSDQTEKLPKEYVDDVSRLNKTRVAEVWEIPAEKAEAEAQLAALLRRAGEAELPVAIAGARHSQGGHTIAPDGIVVDMRPFKSMELDADRKILRVQSGARWKDVIPYLDARGFSVTVMQSDYDFSVGGSLSVNCHGWAYDYPPISSTVESLRLMEADGDIVRCSRVENPELFSLVLGGYGLFGVILDAELRVVPNERLRLRQSIVPADRALATYESRVREEPNVNMAYGRLCIDPKTLFETVIINAFDREPGAIPRLKNSKQSKLVRALFRGSAGSRFGKKLRWEAETKLQPALTGKVFSRNQLLNHSSQWYLDRSAKTTDVLHEYFVPRSRAEPFIAALREIILKHKADLLNVTIRSVKADPDTFMRYADEDCFAFVMFFNQPRTPEGDAAMQALTREIIDAALEAGGSYYLPYRPHATREQLGRAYPRAEEFFALKRKYDPKERFQNQFYLNYGRPAGAEAASN